MSGQLLKQFPLFTTVPSALSKSIPASMAVEWLLALVFFFWAIYTFIAIYHWLKYSHASGVAVPAIALHLLVSLVLVVYALSGALTL